jgi:hypothetical protein
MRVDVRSEINPFDHERTVSCTAGVTLDMYPGSTSRSVLDSSATIAYERGTHDVATSACITATVEEAVERGLRMLGSR